MSPPGFENMEKKTKERTKTTKTTWKHDNQKGTEEEKTLLGIFWGALVHSVEKGFCLPSWDEFQVTRSCLNYCHADWLSFTYSVVRSGVKQDCEFALHTDKLHYFRVNFTSSEEQDARKCSSLTEKVIKNRTIRKVESVFESKNQKLVKLTSKNLSIKPS